MRAFDKSFKVYYPDFNNRRNTLLWKLMVVNPLLNIDVNFKNGVTSNVPIDIYIPVAAKDLNTVASVLASAQKNIKHPINRIFVIAAPKDAVLELAQSVNATFINEDAVLGYHKSRINYSVHGHDRAGWLFQQLLKLNADKIVETDNFLVLDADTLFLKPTVFCCEGKTIFDHSQERYQTYYKVYEAILKRKPVAELSFVTHYMLFNKTALQQLKREIETLHQQKWDDVILAHVDYNDPSGFSEYELYGNYFAENYPDKVKPAYWFNTNGYTNAKHFKTRSVHARLN